MDSNITSSVHGGRIDTDVDAVAKALDSRTQNRILVGIPAYNEEVGIGSVILKARKYADEIVVVDDGSIDDTVEIAVESGATVLEHSENKGKGAAVKTLLGYARSTEFDSMVLLDGDGQHHPSDIPRVASPVLKSDADLVIGSRYNGNGGTETPLYRRFGQQVLDLLAYTSSGSKTTDSQSGFRALSPRAVDNISLRNNGFGVESEMIQEAVEKDLTITEESIDVRYEDVDGQTRNPVYHGFSVVMVLLELIRDRHPLLFFTATGAVITFIGALYGVQGILIYQDTGIFYPAKAMISGFLMILGSIGIYSGLVLNRMSHLVEQIRDETGS